MAPLSYQRKAEIGRQNLANWNKKWKKLKVDPKLDDCISKKGGNIVFDVEKWMIKSYYIERIKRTPKIIDIVSLRIGDELIYITYKHFNPTINVRSYIRDRSRNILPLMT